MKAIIICTISFAVGLLLAFGAMKTAEAIARTQIQRLDQAFPTP